MAIKPELAKAIAYEKIRANPYNKNFQDILDYIEAVGDELKLKVNTINSQLSTTVYNQLIENFKTMYPIGALYFGETDTCPLEELFGTWELISKGRVIQGADDSHRPGSIIEAALPNITGSFGSEGALSGAFYRTGYNVGGPKGGTDGTDPQVAFSASRSSSVYQDGVDTVQPPAYVVNIWKRIE